MIAETKYGKVRGLKGERMYAFRGMPYAKPPVGERRFKPPEEPDAWEGVFDATANGNRAMQINREAGCRYSEDCLNLNVWTPGAQENGAKRPVVFLIHGGGHIEGSNSDPFASGERLIGDKEAVLVSVNYRLGVFGYWYLGDLLGDEYADSGNLGLLDQLLALRWVRENIAAFGGDPDSVVLMGHSAGAKSAAALMTTPRAQGLFRRAILQSGGVQCIRDRQTAARLALRALAALGLEAADATPERLRGLPAETLLAAQAKAFESVLPVHLFGPVVDGRTLAEPPEDFIASGKLRGVPVLIGYAREEMYGAGEGFDEAELPVRLFQTYGLNGSAPDETYRRLRERLPPGEAFAKLQTQYVYTNASVALAQLLAENGCEVWCYRWDFTGREPPGHGSELPYLFGVRAEDNPDWGYPEAFAAMAPVMNATWMAFVGTGDPGNASLPPWPSCASGETGYRMLLDAEPRVEPFNLQAHDKRFPMQVIRL